MTNSATRSAISRFTPALSGDEIGPGIAITGRNNFTVSNTVLIAPLLNAASTIKVPKARPAIIRLRSRKLCLRDGVPAGCSEISAPFLLASANKLLCAIG